GKLLVVVACVKRPEHQGKQHDAGKYILISFQRNDPENKGPGKIKLFFYGYRPKHRKQQCIRLFRPGMHDIEVRCKEQVIPCIGIFLKRRAAYFFQQRKTDKANCHAKIIEGPDTEYPSHIEIRHMDGSCELFFLDEQIGDKEAAEHEKKIHAQVTMP